MLSGAGRRQRWTAWWRATSARLDWREGLGAREQAVVFFIAAMLTMSRLPGLVVHAQFYAEDALDFYGQAYSQGWLHTVMVPVAGYLCMLPRLGAGLELLMPFRWAPLAGILFGVAMQCLPVTVLLSSRCRNWGPLSSRVVFAVLYVGCPNAREIHMVMTNSMWHLTLTAVLLAFGSAPRSWVGRAFDVVVFAVWGTSGPYSIVLLPLIAAFWWFRRAGWTLVQTAVLALCTVEQVHMLLVSGSHRDVNLGASLSYLLRIFGGNVIGAAIFGGHGIGHYAPMPLLVIAAMGGLLLYVYLLRFAPLELKLFALYCILLLAVALRSPLAGDVQHAAWLVLATTSQNRYYFFPMLAFLWGIVWCARYAPHRVFQRAAVAVVALSVIGVTTDWEYKRYPNFDFPASAERMREASPGTPVDITILPNKEWHVVWVKRGPVGRVDRW